MVEEGDDAEGWTRPGVRVRSSMLAEDSKDA